MLGSRLAAWAQVPWSLAYGSEASGTTNSQTDRQTDRQTARQTDRQIFSLTTQRYTYRLQIGFSLLFGGPVLDPDWSELNAHVSHGPGDNGPEGQWA